MDGVADDAFETVAITWSQPEAAVMLAMFAFYGIPAYAAGRWHASVSPIHVVALQGIAVRVASDAVDEALGLLGEVAERPAAVRPYPIGSAYFYRGLIGFALFLSLLAVLTFNPWFALLGVAPLMLMVATPPPTRTASTFLLDKQGPPRPEVAAGPGDDDQPATAS